MGGESAGQRDGEPAPQLRGPELPEHVALVVVAVWAQRLPEPRVVGLVAAQAVQRPAVRTGRPVPAGPARSALPNAVHQSERGRGQGGERRRMPGHRVGHRLAAGQPAGQQVPGIALVLVRARRARRRPPVLAAPVGHPVQLVTRAVGQQHLPGPGVGAGGLSLQPDRPGTTAGPALRLPYRRRTHRLPARRGGHAAPSTTRSPAPRVADGAG